MIRRSQAGKSAQRDDFVIVNSSRPTQSVSRLVMLMEYLVLRMRVAAQLGVTRSLGGAQ
jgi:hypothetical protein